MRTYAQLNYQVDATLNLARVLRSAYLSVLWTSNAIQAVRFVNPPATCKTLGAPGLRTTTCGASSSVSVAHRDVRNMVL